MKAVASKMKEDSKNPYMYNRYTSPSKLKLFLRKYFPVLREYYLRSKYANYVKKDIEEYMSHPNMFQVIEIETINRCNGTCEFCPVNRNVDPRPFAYMQEGLYKKIINELAGLSFDGFLTLHSNNEPLMDKRLVDFIKYARLKVPKAYILFYTNGSLLTIEKLKELLPEMNRIDIDNYDDNYVLRTELQELYHYCLENNIEKSKIRFHMRREHEILTSRGGQAPNKGKVKTIHSQCYLPYVQMVIRPDGKASLCCNDAMGKYTLGDANKQTLNEIWNSKDYLEIRKTMYKTGRKNLELCKYCDTCHDLTF